MLLHKPLTDKRAELVPTHTRDETDNDYQLNYITVIIEGGIINDWQNASI